MIPLEDPCRSEPVLTLKNLYRMLTRRDYPVSSWPVFPRGSMQGESVTRFYFHLFQAALPAETDLSLFTQSDAPPRNLARLLNRSGAPHLLEDWFSELSASLDEALFQRMAKAWTQTLAEKQYVPASLALRLEHLISEAVSARDLASEEISEFFLSLLSYLQSAEADPVPLLFCHSVMLSWLTLYALYGSRPGDPALTRLRIRLDMPFPALYRRFMSRKAGEVRVISARSSVLCVQPLSARNYFGSRTLLADAADRLSRGEKLAVTGIGGTGKTEFTRQLLALLLQSDSWRRLAFVQYADSLAGSFRSAFPAFAGADDPVSAVRALLEDQDEGRTLLLIDNIDRIPAQDPALNDLAQYGCDLIITSRLAPPDGLAEIRLTGLDAESGRRLFLRHLGYGRADPDTADAICASVVGHPLALTLFGRLCRTRFWPAEKLLSLLRDQGLAHLSYINQASQMNLADVFSDTFRLSQLSGDQISLMRLMSLLPYRYWLPEELLPYAVDLCDSESALADRCEVLHDLGWLLVSEEGFAIHPLVAETVRVSPCRASDFPLLWRMLARTPSGDEQTRIFLLLHTADLNADAIRCLSDLELQLARSMVPFLPDSLYQRHAQYLDSHACGETEQADYWLGQSLRDIVEFSRRDRLSLYLRNLLALEHGLSAVRSRECLLTVLEYASSEKDLSVVDEVFRQFAPADKNSAAMAEYLVSFSVRQRVGSRDLPAALASLDQADRLIEALHLSSGMCKANLDYRRAVCLLDLGRAAEACEPLERCLELLEKLGCGAETAKALATRSTFAVALMFSGRQERALEEYRQLAEIYSRQGRTRTAEYAMMRNNTALLLDGLGFSQDARRMELEVLALDRSLGISGEILATHLRNAALIQAHCGEYADALPHAAQAAALRKELFGPDSPWTADAEAVLALQLAHSASGDTALPMLRRAVGILEKEWGPDHRHTRNALAILEEIK